MSNPEFTAPDYTTQSAAQYKANLDAAIASASPVTNLGFSYSAGTLTVHGHEGTALASTNPAFVRFQNQTTAGQNIHISVEANQNFIDDAGASEIIGNLFGFETGVAVDTDVTFHLYAVSNDAMDTVAMMISRDPWATVSPAVADIGAPDDAVADGSRDFWALDSLDETLYDSNPCVRIGSFRMQMSASDDWTVQAIDNDKDGVKERRSVEPSEWELISVGEASSSASLDFVLRDEFTQFKLVLDDVLPATDGADLILRTSSNGGSSFNNGASDYAYGMNRISTASGDQGSTAATYIQLQINQGNATGEECSGDVKVYGAFKNAKTKINSNTTCLDNSGTARILTQVGGGLRASAERNDAIQVLYDSGNIASGTVYCYGRKLLGS